MNKTRLEAFSDGVFAIIITIMVLELKIPKSTEWEAIKELLPKLYCYLLSFIFIGIYWGNHHHLMHTVKKVTPGIMWANMHLLFWLSLVPFVTGWMGSNSFDKVTVATYGALLFLSGLAYNILSSIIKKSYKEETPLTRAIAKDNVKGYISASLYALSIPVALFVHTGIAEACFILVAILWIIPSKAIAKVLDELT